MKTQITSLVNGAKDIRRDLSNSKYINCTKATSHIGYAGTNLKLRAEIAEKVIAENPDWLDIELFGRKLRLNKHSSLSGKTVYFEAKITLDDFMLFSGYAIEPFKHETHFSIQINNDMTVWLNKWTRRSEDTQWKYRGYDYIDESFVTII